MRIVLTVLLVIAAMTVSGWLVLLAPLVWWRELTVSVALFMFTRHMHKVQAHVNRG